MNQVEILIEEATELRRALIAIVLAVGGQVAVSDALVASINLDLDYISTEQDELSQHHVISIKRRGAPDA